MNISNLNLSHDRLTYIAKLCKYYTHCEKVSKIRRVCILVSVVQYRCLICIDLEIGGIQTSGLYHPYVDILLIYYSTRGD